MKMLTKYIEVKKEIEKVVFDTITNTLERLRVNGIEFFQGATSDTPKSFTHTIKEIEVTSNFIGVIIDTKEEKGNFPLKKVENNNPLITSFLEDWKKLETEQDVFIFTIDEHYWGREEKIRVFPNVLGVYEGEGKTFVELGNSHNNEG